MDRYVGLDAHAETCTFAVVGPSGRRLTSKVVETNGQALVEAIRSIPGRVHLCLEEGTQSAWLHEMATQDVVRAKNRLKAVLRGRGILADAGVYEGKSRGKWLKELPAAGHRPAAEWLGRELDQLVPLREEAEDWLLKEAKAHPIIKKLSTAPGMGPLRTAQLAAIVITPYRFRTRRQFWSYCGLAIVTRSSSDWMQGQNGKWTRAVVRQTRGLNRKRQPVLKAVFKGAATTVITQLHGHPLHMDYERMLQSGIKPNLAKLTLARRLAAIVLSMWKREEVYDPQRHKPVTAKS